jgi:hypothetical protein
MQWLPVFFVLSKPVKPTNKLYIYRLVKKTGDTKAWQTMTACKDCVSLTANGNSSTPPTLVK